MRIFFLKVLMDLVPHILPLMEFNENPLEFNRYVVQPYMSLIELKENPIEFNRYVVRHICTPLEGVGGGLINIYYNLFTMKEANKSNFWKYNPELNSFAKQNRRNMTKAEACLWKYLLGGRQLMGYMFNRQRPVAESEYI